MLCIEFRQSICSLNEVQRTRRKAFASYWLRQAQDVSRSVATSSLEIVLNRLDPCVTAISVIHQPELLFFFFSPWHFRTKLLVKSSCHEISATSLMMKQHFAHHADETAVTYDVKAIGSRTGHSFCLRLRQKYYFLNALRMTFIADAFFQHHFPWTSQHTVWEEFYIYL